jgi:hypothetical protein
VVYRSPVSRPKLRMHFSSPSIRATCSAQLVPLDFSPQAEICIMLKVENQNKRREKYLVSCRFSQSRLVDSSINEETGKQVTQTL